jgi:hypothetical protein
MKKKKVKARVQVSPIKRNIPIPQHRAGKNIELIMRMQVGDCIVVPSRAVANGLFVAARRHGKIKLLSRENENGYINVWRVK